MYLFSVVLGELMRDILVFYITLLLVFIDTVELGCFNWNKEKEK